MCPEHCLPLAVDFLFGIDQEHVALCIHVCWSCYWFGGTDVVLITSVWVSEGHCMDKFNYESDHYYGALA